mgnify:CR=1 FL=1
MARTRTQSLGYLFTWLMLGAAIAFLVVVRGYRERSYLQDEAPA